MSYRDDKEGGLEAPASGAFNITPDDDLDLPTTRAIFVGGAGDLEVVMLSGSTVTFTNLVDGQWLPIRVKRVLEDTTATNIIGLV